MDAVSWMRCCTHHVGVFCVGLLFQLGATSPAAVAGAGVAPGSHSRSVPVRAAVVLREKQPHGGGGYLLRRIRLPNPRVTLGEHTATQIISKTLRILTSKRMALKDFISNKTASVRITLHWGAFVQPLLQWKSNKYYIFWVWVCSLGYSAFNGHAPYCHL